MKCPKCGIVGAKPVKLFTSISYLCTSKACKLFDKDHAATKREKSAGKTIAGDDLNIEWDFSYADWYPLIDDDILQPDD